MNHKLDRLNRIKEKLSFTYLSALTSHLDLVLTDCRGSEDDVRFGIDCTISKPVDGINRAESICGRINIQLKATCTSSDTMYSEDEDNIYYKLAGNLDPVGMYYLIILILPSIEDFDLWIEVEKDKLIMKKCAYYLKLDKKYVDDALKHGKITISKQNLLSLDSLPKLFINPNNKEEAY